MIRCVPESQRGFTTIEIVLVIAISSLVLVVASTGVRSADNLSEESRARLRMSADYREGHRVVAERLRNAALDSLAGFDSQWASTRPTFQVVQGMEAGAATLGAVEEIAYERTHANLGGSPAGRLVAGPVGGAQVTLVEPVREDTFRVVLEGSSLRVSLGIVYVDAHGHTYDMKGETVVSLRN